MVLVPPVGGAMVMGFLAGWDRVLAGMRDYLNVMISFWNEKYSDNLSYLGSFATTQENLTAFCLVFLLLCIAGNGYLLSKGKLIPLFGLVVFYFAPGIILEQSSARGSICLLLSAVGVWLFFFQAGSRAAQNDLFCSGVGRTACHLFSVTGRKESRESGFSSRRSGRALAAGPC